MKKYAIITFILLLFSLLLGWEQKNNIPPDLKVLYPFSVEITFEKPYNLIKADLPLAKNLLINDEDEWRVTVTDSLVLTLMALQTGEIEVPALKITCHDELGADTLYTQPFMVSVMAVTDSTSVLTDIKAIQGAKDPILLESQYNWIFKLIKYLLGIIILALLGWLIYLKYDWIKRALFKDKFSEEDILLLPWEFSLKEVALIRKKMLLVRGKEYPFSIEMSLLIRRFLEKYYKFPASVKTTYELKADLAKINVSNSEKIIDVLKELDIVKYTKGKIVADFNSEEILAWFERYILNIQEFEGRKTLQEGDK
ncbi:hypothetical protein JEZ13_05940 [bacterium]|nr:hypothetical protein [bacterium]